MTNEMKQMIDSMKKYNEGYIVPTTSSTPVSTSTEKLLIGNISMVMMED